VNKRPYGSKSILKKPEPKKHESSVTVSARSAFVSQFVIPSGMKSYDKSVLQSDVLVTLKNGFYLDVWNSTQLKKKPIGRYDIESADENGNPYTETVTETAMEANPGYETDYNLGWSGPIALGISLDAGVIYCDLLKYGRAGSLEDVIYNYIKLSHAIGAGFNGQIMGERFSLMKKSPYRGGNLYAIGTTRSDTIVVEKLTIDSSLEYVHDTGVYGYEPGEIIRGKVGLNVKVYRDLNAILQVNFFEPLTVREGYTQRIVHSVGLAYQFQ
jgi:hypothetical protein